MKTLTILGSTGSIGQCALDVVRAHPGRFQVKILTAHENVARLAAQAREFDASKAVIGRDGLLEDLKAALSETDIECAAGEQALIEAASQPSDICVAAIVGMAGLRPMLSAIRNSRCVAIANKEPLVSAGPLVLKTARESGCTLLPLDSEHNAVFQGFDPRAHKSGSINRLILTASGGPFRTWSLEKISSATVEQALAHPNWSMGKKISVDSATMMNKGLEIIEAARLFNMPGKKIDVLIHPQSFIHAMVEYSDGSILAQLGAPDMRTPIAHVLGWPDRIATPGRRLDLPDFVRMDFELPDDTRFPALRLAYDSLEAGLPACIALNAANEVAVESFLDRHLPFGSIIPCVRECLEEDIAALSADPSLEEILSLDLDIRARARHIILRCSDKHSISDKKAAILS